MKKEILITGSTGFLGKEVTKYLVSNNYKVKHLCRKKKKFLYTKSKIISSNLEDGFPEIKIKNNSLLIHLAWNNIKDTLNKNHLERELDIQFNFLKEAINRGLKKVIVAGTCYEYGIVYGPIDVNHPTNPVTPYGMAKKKLYQRLAQLKLKKNFDLIWARIFYVYGDNDESGNIVSQFDRAVRNGDKFFPMSLGEQLLDYSRISDIAKKILKLIDSDDGVYNLCSGNPISLRRFIEIRKQKKLSTIKLDLGRYSYRKIESIAFWGIPNI